MKKEIKALVSPNSPKEFGVALLLVIILVAGFAAKIVFKTIKTVWLIYLGGYDGSNNGQEEQNNAGFNTTQNPYL